jgi:hypothetical protein
VKWQALRNRVAAIQARLPGPHTVLKIEGGLPPGAMAKIEPSPAAADPEKATGVLKSRGLLDTSQG